MTGRIRPGVTGAVVVGIRGGSEEFHAYALNPADVIERGIQVLVIEYEPPRTVYVTKM